MAFRLEQSGDLRRPNVQFTVTDLKKRASEGASFWRGLVLGLAAGLVVGYAIVSGHLLGSLARFLP